MVTDDLVLREKRVAFSDRHDAGDRLGALLRTRQACRDPVVLAISAGGVPAGVEVALALDAPFFR